MQLRLRPECLDLADFALVDEPQQLRAQASELAHLIEETIEDWIAAAKDEIEQRQKRKTNAPR